MAREGSRKVKTGCLTCKARRIKCDEAKPQCGRCISAGRKCGGYAMTSGAFGLLWHRPRQLFQGINSSAEGNALQFFCEVAGPFLAGATDPYFWTHVVMQFSDFEPAVRHSVIAISSLYERKQITGDSDAASYLDCFALQHYNAAIREIQNSDNQPLVILVCILFICIEFLRLNRKAAMQHCKHGTALIQNISSEYPWTEQYLVPIFQRLNVFPFFFGGQEDFPNLFALDQPIPHIFNTYAEARTALDTTMSRAMRLLRHGDQCRFDDLIQGSVSPELLAEQTAILEQLDNWHAAFMGLTERLTTYIVPTALHNFGPDISQQVLRAYLLVVYESCQIFAKSAFHRSEMGSDSCLDGYRKIVRTAEMATASDYLLGLITKQPHFVFELGFMPHLSNVAMKCRDLEARLAALRMMRTLGIRQEGLFDGCSMFALARRSTEIEHGIILDNQGYPVTEAICPGLPQETRRIRAAIIVLGTSVEQFAGRHFHGMVIGFSIPESDGTICFRTEFLPQDLDAARSRGFDNMCVLWMNHHETGVVSNAKEATIMI